MTRVHQADPIPLRLGAAAGLAAMDEAAQELATGDWHLTARDRRVARGVLELLDALAGDGCRGGPLPSDEASELHRDALAAVATGALQTEGGLHQLLAAACTALEPLVHSCAAEHTRRAVAGRPCCCQDAHRAEAEAESACACEAEEVLHRLRALLHAGLDGHAAPASAGEQARCPVRGRVGG